MNTTLLPAPVRSHRGQRGVASLLVALMLLLGGTIMAFFANRGFIFEQRTSANQYRATKAFELAEAGLEWGLGKLNENLPLAAGTDCSTGGAAANPSFRDRFATPTAGTSGGPGSLNTSFASMPSCRIDAAGAATCICPTAAGTTANHASTFTDQGRFGVRFRGGAEGTVEIIARGCTNGTAACDPDDTAYAAADATAVTRMLVKVVPALPSGPAAPLTTGSAAVVGGNLSVINTHAPSNGITIHSGATVQAGSGTNVYTLPGTPPRASIVDNDPALNNLTLAGEEAFFANFFGQTLTNYRTIDPDVIRISGCSATDCGTQVMNVVNSGARNPRFFVDGDITFNNGNVGASTIGTVSNPVVIVSNATMEMRSNLTAYGLFYAATATATENWDFDGSGTATIYGAFISRGNFDKGSGTLNLIYDPSLWSGSGAPMGRLVKVPGSWRDKATNY